LYLVAHDVKRDELHFRGPATGHLSMRGPGYDARSIYVGFVVDKMALVQGFPRVGYFGISSISTIPRQDLYLLQKVQMGCGAYAPPPPVQGSKHPK